MSVWGADFKNAPELLATAQAAPGADVSAATPATAPRAGGEQVGTRMPFHAVSANASRAATGGPKHRGKGKGAQPAATPATALSALQENRIGVAHAMEKLATQGTVRGADGAAPASWSAATTIVWSKGLEGMGDVHGRPSKKSVAAAQACSHLDASMLSVGPGGGCASRTQLVDVLEAALCMVKADLAEKPSPADGGGAGSAPSAKPKVRRYASVFAMEESREKRRKRRSSKLVASDKGVHNAADALV